MPLRTGGDGPLGSAGALEVTGASRAARRGTAQPLTSGVAGHDGTTLLEGLRPPRGRSVPASTPKARADRGQESPLPYPGSGSARRGCCACIQSAAACALDAAVKMAEASLFKTLSQEAM